jgi:hypothetical protein
MKSFEANAPNSTVVNKGASAAQCKQGSRLQQIVVNLRNQTAKCETALLSGAW